jgi:hypothetical protein
MYMCAASAIELAYVPVQVSIACRTDWYVYVAPYFTKEELAVFMDHRSGYS